MNKVIIVSVRPEHAVKILNGEKTLELRKSVPKDFIGWVYIYVTKASPFLAHQVVDYDDIMGYPSTAHYYGTENEIDGFEQPIDSSELLNGKIVARFWFDGCEDFYTTIEHTQNHIRKLKTTICSYKKIPAPHNMYKEESLKKMCLSYNEVYNYLNHKKGYAWNIKKLEVFDEPKSLEYPPEDWRFTEIEDFLQ